jgi:hypothetical protein
MNSWEENHEPAEYNEGFSINNDMLAEWALGKIAEEKEETERLTSICRLKVFEYEEKIQQYKKQLETKTAYFRGQLQQYFESVPHKATKTQESYKLPSGTLKLKLTSPEFVRDEEAFTQYLKDNHFTEFIKVKETADWGAFKKIVAIIGNKVVDSNGSIVEGITLVERPPVFEIDI